jgi:hypothetical protein
VYERELTTKELDGCVLPEGWRAEVSDDWPERITIIAVDRRGAVSIDLVSRVYRFGWNNWHGGTAGPHDYHPRGRGWKGRLFDLAATALKKVLA